MTGDVHGEVAVEPLLEHASQLANMRMHRCGFLPNHQQALYIVDNFNDLLLIEEPGNGRPLAASLHDAIQVQIAVSRALLFPVRRLPMEIFSFVFIEFSKNSSTVEYHRADAVRTSIARVCIAWRTLAFNTPALWTCICSLSTLALQKALLRMSGVLPLRFCRLFKRTLEFDQELREVNLFIDFMRPDLYRWNSAQLVLSRADVFASIPSLGRLSALSCASVVLGEASVCHTDALEFMVDAPALQDFDIKVTSAIPSHEHLQLCSSHRAAWNLPPIAQYDAALTHLVVHVSVNSFRYHQQPLDIDPVHITLSVLEVAKLTRHAHQLLPYIRAPRLRSVTLDDVNAEQMVGDPFASLLRFLETSEVSLRALEINEISVADTGVFVECLTRLVSLERLTVTSDYVGHCWTLSGLFTDAVLRRMINAEDDHPLEPNLTSSQVNLSVWVYPVPHPLVVRFVRSRLTPAIQCSCQVAALRHAYTNSHLYGSREDFEVESDEHTDPSDNDTESDAESDGTTSENEHVEEAD